MGQVNRIPNGFLDLLGVESLGRNPPLFSDAVSPIVNLNEFYSGQTLSCHEEDLIHDDVDQQALVTVPEGETWLLRSVGLESDSWGAASRTEQWEFSVDSLPRQETGVATAKGTIYTTPFFNAIGGTQKNIASYFLAAPLVCISGVVLRARIINRILIGTAHTTSLRWLFNRFNS